MKKAVEMQSEKERKKYVNKQPVQLKVKKAETMSHKCCLVRLCKVSVQILKKVKYGSLFHYLSEICLCMD